MGSKVISVEERLGPYRPVFDRIMGMVPDRERGDKDLQRLLTFRLRRDGEGATIEFLTRKIRDMIRCAYTGRLYDVLKDDQLERRCRPAGSPPPDPPLGTA